MPTPLQNWTASRFQLPAAEVERREADGFKYCGACRAWLPATAELFYLKGDGRLLNTCRACRLKIRAHNYKQELRRALRGEPNPQASE